ncbi:MAG: hypothetical protein LQ340_001019 [Diploschistes diacapsis]|nr:MAG: hypothetical protein LQ340_001019 [Diploschistes diacapsis]
MLLFERHVVGIARRRGTETRLCRRFHQTWRKRQSQPSIAEETSATAGQTYLPSRGLLEVRGRDAPQFLQGLTTANIPCQLPERPAVQYAAFLNAQGRLLQDVFIYRLPPDSPLLDTRSTATGPDPVFLIEVDANQASTLLKWLRKYKLRSKIALRSVPADELAVSSVWDDGQSTEHLEKQLEGNAGQANTVATADNRAPGFGLRVLHRMEERFSSKPRASFRQYTLRRYLHCIPEGQAELPCESALLHESCIDYMGGVDFRKGCYVGQELVIRTQHTGVVRKRILPCILYQDPGNPPTKLAYEDASVSKGLADSVPPGADVKSAMEEGKKARSKGKWLAGVGNIGLALCRLEDMVGLGPTGEKTENWDRINEWCLDWEDQGAEAKGLRITGFVPHWWAQRREALKKPQ